MNLFKSTGTIGGLTLVSRIAGFAREMLMSRVMGASWQADAFFVAFRLPNTFRRAVRRGRLFGRFRAALRPAPAGRGRRGRGQHFSEEVLAVFAADAGAVHRAVRDHHAAPFVAAISGYHGEKLALATFLTRITFPYLILISLVSLFSGHPQQPRPLHRGGFRPRPAQPRDARPR